MEYSCNKYTVIEYVIDGTQLEEKVVFGDDHDNAVEAKVEEIHSLTGVSQLTLSIQYHFETTYSEVV